MIDILIVARSGRALATSAHQAGFKVHVMDCFADEDTKAVSNSTYQLGYHCDGFDKAELIEQVTALVSDNPKAVLVVGTGFEKTPELLENLAAIIPVVSNDKNTIHELKDPVALHNLLKCASIKTPEISLTRPIEHHGWLSKDIGGIGGGHVKWLSQINSNTGSVYYQKYIKGIVSSALFLAMKTHAILVGINEQLQSEDFNEMPFLYKGVVKLNAIDEQYRKGIDEIINKITTQAALKGLCGIDYIVEQPGDIVVLEVNPRPPASFELYDHHGGLFNAHLACFEGKEFDSLYSQDGLSKGYAIYYAKQDIKISSKINWPDWVKDIPSAGSLITEKFPVCSVHAADKSTDKLKAVLQNQLNYIETIIMTEQHAA